MKNYKITPLIIAFIIGITGCSLGKKLRETSSIHIDKVFFQKWVAGIENGGSGVNVVIVLSDALPENIVLDSIYFRQKGTMLEKIENERTQFIGRFKTNFNQKTDFNMSIDSKNEYGNQPPTIQKKIPFELKDDECIISYKEGNMTKYLKIEKVMEKQSQKYPSAPIKAE